MYCLPVKTVDTAHGSKLLVHLVQLTVAHCIQYDMDTHAVPNSQVNTVSSYQSECHHPTCTHLRGKGLHVIDLPVDDHPGPTFPVVVVNVLLANHDTTLWHCHPWGGERACFQAHGAFDTTGTIIYAPLPTHTFKNSPSMYQYVRVRCTKANSLLTLGQDRSSSSSLCAPEASRLNLQIGRGVEVRIRGTRKQPLQNDEVWKIGHSKVHK